MALVELVTGASQKTNPSWHIKNLYDSPSCSCSFLQQLLAYSPISTVSAEEKVSSCHFGHWFLWSRLTYGIVKIPGPSQELCAATNWPLFLRMNSLSCKRFAGTLEGRAGPGWLIFWANKAPVTTMQIPLKFAQIFLKTSVEGKDELGSHLR